MLKAHTRDAPGVRHGFFTREGGVSDGIYAGLNCGPGSDDSPDAVAENRARAVASLDESTAGGIQGSDSGDLDVPVVVTDAEGVVPVECVMQWAWRPRR